MNIKELLDFVLKKNSSDLHLTSDQVPILRIQGSLIPMRVDKISSETVKAMLLSLMTEKQIEEYEKDFELDFAIEFRDSGRFRINAFHTIKGPAAVFRYIPFKISSIEELKLPTILNKIASIPKGLVLVTGPTGSGKSTTLAAMIDYVNSNFNKHILTIEDPIEFVYQSKKCLINQREVNSHTKSFASALKSSLREDPDVILVGELRDLETISLALTAAETGHLVLATLHTSSAVRTVDRIIDVFPEGDKPVIRAMLSSSVKAIISQILIPTIDKTSRVAAHEILLTNSAVRNLIRENRIHQILSIMQINSKNGMSVMKDTLKRYVQEGLISKAEANTFTELEEKDNLLENNSSSGTGGGGGSSSGF